MDITSLVNSLVEPESLNGCYVVSDSRKFRIDGEGDLCIYCSAGNEDTTYYTPKADLQTLYNFLTYLKSRDYF